ncbi:MAG: guanine deaminase [Monoraphidium minutum]|nr:MAG: guanine deaminase [Monoraphidium minutum]
MTSGGGPDPVQMRRAIALARKAGLEDKTGRPFGSVVVGAGGKVLGEGSNQVVARQDPTWHAEMEAIRAACAKLGTTNLAGCTIYASSQPCPMCTGAIYWSGISHCYYGAGIEDLSKHGVYSSARDTFYGREDRLEPPQRTQVPFTQIMREEAAAVHGEYGKTAADQRANY